MKKILTLFAIFAMAISAQAASPLKLKVSQYPWNYTFKSESTLLSYSSTWGEYSVINAGNAISPTEYKGFRVEYEGYPSTAFDDNGWLRYVQVKLGPGDGVQYVGIDPNGTECVGEFNDDIKALDMLDVINIQAVYEGVKISIKDFYLIKADGTEESVWPGAGGGWGFTQEPSSEKGVITFTGQYGSLEVVDLEDNSLTYGPGESDPFDIVFTFDSPTTNALFLELDNAEGSGFGWINIPIGTTEFTATINDESCTQELAGIFLKSSASEGYPFDISYSSIILKSTDEILNAEDLAVNVSLYPWNYSFTYTKPSAIVFTSQWGAYNLINTPIDIAEYKGFRMEYESFPATGEEWNYVQVNVQDKQYNPLSPNGSMLSADFNEDVKSLESLESFFIQCVSPGAAVIINKVYLVKEDGTEEEITPTGGGWGHYFAPNAGILNFTGQWGSVKIIDYTTFNDISYEPGKSTAYKYVLELNEPSPTDLLFEADDEESAVAYFGFPAGQKEYSFEITDKTCGGWEDDVFVPKAMTSLNLKSPAADGYPLGINIKRIYRVPIEQAPAGLRGDANGDGSVSLIDVLITVDYYLGKNPDGFILDNAEMDGDGEISLADLLGIVDIILTQETE